MVDLNKIKKESEFTYELYGPVELVNMEEINAIHPDDKEEVFIQFRRLMLTEMADAAANDLDDLALAKKIVKGWGGYTQDGKPTEYKPKLLELLPYQDIDWILKEAYAATTMQATDLPTVTFNLRQMTQTQRKALQQKSLKGFRNKKASQRMQTLLLQKTIIGWEGVCYKGKEVAYSPDLVNLLPWSVVAEILEARPEAEDPGAIEAAGKN